MLKSNLKLVKILLVRCTLHGVVQWPACVIMHENLSRYTILVGGLSIEDTGFWPSRIYVSQNYWRVVIHQVVGELDLGKNRQSRREIAKQIKRTMLKKAQAEMLNGICTVLIILSKVALFAQVHYTITSSPNKVVCAATTAQFCWVNGETTALAYEMIEKVESIN